VKDKAWGRSREPDASLLLNKPTYKEREMSKGFRAFLIGLCCAGVAAILPAQQMPHVTKQSISGKSTLTKEKFHGTVVEAEGNHLVVRMSSGNIRIFEVPVHRTFIIDGRELTANDLKPGTTLTATVTTIKTPVVDRTTTVGSGKVFHVSGNTVILTLPNNENRMYKVPESYRFVVDGQPASVSELRKGMVVSAQKIVEEPRTELASHTKVIGSGPPAR
jgi:hypothetical protein